MHTSFTLVIKLALLKQGFSFLAVRADVLGYHMQLHLVVECLVEVCQFEAENGLNQTGTNAQLFDTPAIVCKQFGYSFKKLLGMNLVCNQISKLTVPLKS